MKTKRSLLRACLATVMAGALTITATGTAMATDIETTHLATYGKPHATEIANVSDSEVEQIADQIETLFTEYLTQDQNGRWSVTEAGALSGIPSKELEDIAASLNIVAESSESGVAVKPLVSDYTKCVINASGLGAIGGLFTGAFSTLIEKHLWKEAAMYIIKLVGKNAIKGGVVGLAAFLAASAIWCTTPWSK